MASFLTRLSGWMATSSSIIGTAVATPSLIGALTGTLSWRDAALPLIGSAVSILLPQATPALTTRGTSTDGAGIPVTTVPGANPAVAGSVSRIEQAAKDVSQIANRATETIAQLAANQTGANAPKNNPNSPPGWKQDLSAAANFAPVIGAVFGPVGAAAGAAVPELISFAESAYAEFTAASGKLAAARAAVNAAAGQLSAAAHNPVLGTAPASAAVVPPPAAPAAAPAPAAPVASPAPLQVPAVGSVILTPTQMSQMQAQMTANAQAAFDEKGQIAALKAQLAEVQNKAVAQQAALATAQQVVAAVPPVTVAPPALPSASPPPPSPPPAAAAPTAIELGGQVLG